MIEAAILIFMIAIGVTAIIVFIYYSTRRGEDCFGYPHRCPWCRYAAECIIEIGRRDKE